MTSSRILSRVATAIRTKSIVSAIQDVPTPKKWEIALRERRELEGGGNEKVSVTPDLSYPLTFKVLVAYSPYPRLSLSLPALQQCERTPEIELKLKKKPKDNHVHLMYIMSKMGIDDYRYNEIKITVAMSALLYFWY